MYFVYSGVIRLTRVARGPQGILLYYHLKLLLPYPFTYYASTTSQWSPFHDTDAVSTSELLKEYGSSVIWRLASVADISMD